MRLWGRGQHLPLGGAPSPLSAERPGPVPKKGLPGIKEGLRVWLLPPDTSSSFALTHVLHHLHLDTLAPIVAIREILPAPAPGTHTRRKWLSGQELKAVSALLELSAAQAGPCADSGAEQRDP